MRFGVARALLSAVETSFETDIPARLDSLTWSVWHWRVVLALGITWMLDGLEVTMVGALGSVLQDSATLGLSATQVGAAGSIYIAGAIVGALGFGHLADRYGRKRLFFATLTIYVAATLSTAASVGFASFAVCRFFTGTGIGGEYSAICSAIDELIPARLRGTVNLSINGSYWAGTALAAALTSFLLDRACWATRTAGARRSASGRCWRWVFCSSAAIFPNRRAG